MKTFKPKLNLIAVLLWVTAAAGNSATVTWNGATDMNWTQPDPTSWSGSTFNNGDTAQFGDTGAGTVNISVGGVTPGAVIVNSLLDYTFSGGGIGGSATLTKAGAGTLSLTSSSTFTGGMTIDAGTLQLGNSNPGTTMTLGGGTYAGNITIAGGATLNCFMIANETFSGIISGGGNLVVAYTTLTLGNNNTYTGKTSIKPQKASGGGTVIVSSFNSVNGGTPLFASSSLGAPINAANGTIQIGNGLVQSGCTLKYNGPGETTDRIISLQSNGSSSAGPTLDASGSGLLKFTSAFQANAGGTMPAFTLTGTGRGEIVKGLPQLPPGGLDKQGSGIWTLDGTNTYTTPTTISSGILEIGGAGVLGGGAYAGNIENNATFSYNSTATQTLSGVISGTGNLIVTNTGNLILTGVNTYSGVMTVKGGTLTGVTGYSCSNSSLTVTNSPGLTSSLGVLVTNSTQQWTCKSLTFKTNGVGSQLRFRYTVAPSTNIAPLNITSNLTFAGTPEVVMDPANLTPGTYPLLVVGGVVPPGVPSLSSDGLKELGYQGRLEWSGKTLLLRLSTFGTVISIR